MSYINLATGLPFAPSWPKVRQNHASPYISLGEAKPYGEAASPQTFWRARGLVLGARGIACRAADTDPYHGYYSDGLVLMLDGIDNTATGRHDGTATQWTDIAGNYNFSVGPCSWGSNHVKILQDSAYTGYPRCNHFINDSQISTIECVFSVSGTTAGGKVFSSGYGRQRWVTFRAAKTINFYNSGPCFAHNLSTIVCAAFTYGTGTLYKDGSPVASAGSGFYGGANSVNVASFNNDTQYRVDADVYALRIYNTTLTADQLAANYAVDKARFGLA